MISKATYNKFLKFLFFGGVAYIIRAGVPFLLTDFIGIDYKITVAISILIVLIGGFFANFYITFEKHHMKSSVLVSYVIAELIFDIVNYGLIIALTEILGLYYQSSIVVIGTFVAITKFFTFDKVVFTGD